LRDPEAIANWPANQGRDGARTPMPWSSRGPFGGFSQVEPWLPMPAEHRKRAVGVQEKDGPSVLAVTRKLVSLRKSHPAIHSGGFITLKLRPPLLGFERLDTNERVRCLFNLGASARRCRLLQEGRLLFSSGKVDQAKGVLGPRAACWLTV